MNWARLLLHPKNPRPSFSRVGLETFLTNSTESSGCICPKFLFSRLRCQWLGQSLYLFVLPRPDRKPIHSDVRAQPKGYSPCKVRTVHSRDPLRIEGGKSPHLTR